MTSPPDRMRVQQVPLVDLLDRLLASGVVISGDLLICVADVDLVRVSLRALLASVGDELSAAGKEGR